MDADLVSYIKQSLRDGVSERRIKHQLEKQGWQPSQIAEAFRAAKRSRSSSGADGGSHRTGVIVGLVLLLAFGGVGTSLWLVLGGDQAVPAGQPGGPDAGVDNESDLEGPGSSDEDDEPVGNETDANESDEPPTYISPCERLDVQREKYTCYRDELSGNVSSVNCRALPQPDRRLCTHALERLVTT